MKWTEIELKDIFKLSKRQREEPKGGVIMFPPIPLSMAPLIINRRVAVTSDQFHREGILHFYAGKYAFVEMDNGHLERYDITGCYGIQFLDKVKV